MLLPLLTRLPKTAAALPLPVRLLDTQTADLFTRSLGHVAVPAFPKTLH